MNLILLHQEDFLEDNVVQLRGRRQKHVVDILHPTQGDVVIVGVLNGNVGEGKIKRITTSELVLEVFLNDEPPKPLDVALIVSLPRPLMVKRILFSAAMMGVKKIVFINSKRVEKTYWQSRALELGAMTEQLILGLEQAGDTILPDVSFEKSFKCFVEDRMPQLIQDRDVYVGLLSARKPCPKFLESPAAVIIGPEGGFIPYEEELLVSAGALPVKLGERILRVPEAAVAFLSRFI